MTFAVMLAAWSAWSVEQRRMVSRTIIPGTSAAVSLVQNERQFALVRSRSAMKVGTKMVRAAKVVISKSYIYISSLAHGNKRRRAAHIAWG